MAPLIWVRVGSRRELEELHRRRVGDVYVVRSGRTQIYGRPGDRLCVELDEAEVAANPRRVVAGLPVRAGVLVPASAAGLAVLAEAKARGRGPLRASPRGRRSRSRSGGGSRRCCSFHPDTKQACRRPRPPGWCAT